MGGGLRYMRPESSDYSQTGARGAPTVLLDHPTQGGPKRPGTRARWKLLIVVVTTALLSAILASSLLPGAAGRWDPLAASQWLGILQPGAPTALPQATLPADFGVTPFPSPIPTNPAVAGGTRRDPQGCGRTGTPPVSVRPLLVSTKGSPGTRGEIALTFDDGPNPIYTQQIIDILHAWNAPATFFIVGVHARYFPFLVQEEAADGFAIGNHTLTHASLLRVSPAAASGEISSASAIIRSLTRNDCLWLFRPPYGSYNPTVISIARKQGFTSMLWDVDALDWTRPGAKVIANRVISNLHAGAIILMHDSGPDNEIQDRSQTVAALPLILAAIRARGLRPVTLPTLLSDAGYVHLQP